MVPPHGSVTVVCSAYVTLLLQVPLSRAVSSQAAAYVALEGCIFLFSASNPQDCSVAALPVILVRVSFVPVFESPNLDLCAMLSCHPHGVIACNFMGSFGKLLCMAVCLYGVRSGSPPCSVSFTGTDCSDVSILFPGLELHLMGLVKVSALSPGVDVLFMTDPHYTDLRGRFFLFLSFASWF